jgi:signal transduction histidine kinase
MAMAPRLRMFLGRVRRFLRTTAVRLSVVYLLVFTLISVAMIVYVGRNASEVLTRDLRTTIDQEVDELEQIYQERGLRALIDAVDARSRVPGASLYYVADISGNLVVGNIAEVPPAILNDPTAIAHPVPYFRGPDWRRGRPRSGEGEMGRRALVRVLVLDEGFRVLVGRDLGEQGRMREVFAQSFRIILGVVVVLGLVTWWFISRQVLRRIDQVSETGSRIVAGDLSGRLPVTGSGDEFDRLATGLNAMLDRIEALMKGLKEVSDNIAHDLKTPLTRMRNRLDAALAGADDVGGHRAALEATIEESDALIRTFDALLMIARVEAGNQPAALETIDLAAIARDVCELYEPLAEEEGFALSVDAERPVPVAANRELLSQAVANLMDNAFKYGRAEGRPPAITLSVAADGTDGVLTVADNGPGVPAADRDRVLARFVRLEASRNASGSGLGLSLVAAVARHHGGSVVLGDAAPGLKVTIRVPRAAA